MRPITATGLLCLLLLPSPALAQTQDCSVFIKDAFNTSLQIKGASSSAFFHRVECSSEFKNHDEAIASGLSVGTVVYGVPLKIGGSFDETKADEWKKAHCSDEERRASSAEATYSFIRTYAPEAAEVAKTCLDKRQAVRCSFSGEGGNRIFTAEWIRTNGDNTPPVVADFYVVNGKCSGPLTKGFAMTEGIVAPICAFTSDENMIASLQTSRGSCFDTAQKKFEEVIVSGTQILTENKVYQGDIVRFADGAKIVTNGFDLTINARKEIKVTGSPSIVSFDGDGPKLPLGAAGKPAGLIVLQSPLISGTQLAVSNFGQNGAKGIAGEAGIDGRDAVAGHWVNRIYGGECRGGSNASAGGKGNVGKVGGSGGSGGKVIISIMDGLYDGVVQRVSVNSKQTLRDGNVRDCDGSCGGLGGIAGDGGRGGKGGSGASHNGVCGGRGGASNGPMGDPGVPGKNGEDTPVQILR